MRVVFLGSPQPVVTILQRLHELHSQGEISYLGVVSQPARTRGRRRQLADPPVATFAKEHQLDLLQPESAKDPAFLEEFRSWKPDLAITAAYGQILSDEFLRIPSRAVINIHPSLLPKYRGATPVQASLLAGETNTGTTALFTVKQLDAGAIIAVRPYTIRPLQTARTLLDDLFSLGRDLVDESMLKLKDPLFTGTSQDESLATFCKKIKKDDGRIDWRLSATEIWQRFRAFDPWPGSYTTLSGRRIVVTGMAPRSLSQNTKTLASLISGTGYIDGSKLCIKTGEGELEIQSLKPEGSKEMDSASFWRGLKLSSETLQFD